MQIDNCLILSAGEGTRMGIIGQRLPKVLWPIFEKTLLELQILYAKTLGCSKIFINSHFYYPQIKAFVSSKKFDNVYLVHEEELLDIGGAVHNLINLGHVATDENLLIMGGDQFLVFDKKYLSELLARLPQNKVILFPIAVSYNSGQNEIIVRDELLQEIVPYKKRDQSKSNYFTYSGTCLVNLQKISPAFGPSKFFASVADYKSSEILVPTIQDAKYWDFGTIKRYYESIQKLYGQYTNQSTEPFLQFCIEQNVFSNEVCATDIHAYGSKVAGVYNFAKTPLSQDHTFCQNSCSIILHSSNSTKYQGPGLYYDELFEKVT
ncbi:MAG: NTP transferase domain-containing protein [Bacteriovoracaceae bacterium]|nr:NTP transferase domain-containing protein [Bacteriovoracaceae bacterium]